MDYGSCRDAILRLFRPDVQDDPAAGFDRLQQLTISAKRLEHLRGEWPDFWRAVGDASDVRLLHGPQYRGLREFKLRIADEVRQADESADYRRTVAFVSESVLKEIYADSTPAQRSRQRFSAGALSSNRFSHEHGVPVDTVMRIVLHPENDGAPLLNILSALSCRSLLMKAEECAVIDRHYKQVLPSTAQLAMGPFIEAGLFTLPPSFWPLVRYHRAKPELVARLVPVSSWAATELREFRDFLEVRRPEDIARFTAKGTRPFRLPDGITRPPLAVEIEGGDLRRSPTP
jgi:hypothetical protein